MKAHLLVLHRTESYPGQFAPEVVAVCDEWTLDDNPEWWTTEKVKQRDLIGNDASAWAEVVIELDDDTLMTALYPRPAVAATITSATRLSGPGALDPRITNGSYVLDVNADPSDVTVDDIGYVDSVQDGGYGVIWNLGDTPRYTAADEITWIDQDLAETTITGS